MTDKHTLVERLTNEGALNGGDGAYAWRARNLCTEAATRITALEAREAELVEVLRDMLWAFVDSEDPAEARSIQRTDAATYARATLAKHQEGEGND